MKKTFLTLLAVAGMLYSQAQVKEGSVTFAMNIEGLPPEAQSMMKGAEMKIYFKDKKSRSETTNAFQSTITVADENSSTTLIEQMGQKQYYKLSKADMEKEAKKNPEPKITYTEEKKTIAGYECKKAIVETKDDKGQEQKINVWYTEKLQHGHAVSGGKGTNPFKGLKGAPLEFGFSQGQMKINFTATAVSTAPVADSKFVVSTDGYTEIKMEDLMKQRQGGGGAH